MRLFSTLNPITGIVFLGMALTVAAAGQTPAPPAKAPAPTAAAKPPPNVKVADDVSHAVIPVASSDPAAAHPDTQNPAGLNPQEAEFVDLINHERTSRGLNALTVDPLLVQVARGHSAEMCQLNYFDHHSPTPGIVTPMDRYMKALKDASQPTPDYVLVGENIYYCSILNDHYNVAFGHQSLMNSPGHRANILEPRFVKVGVGTYRDAKGEFWVTETFLRDTQPPADSGN